MTIEPNWPLDPWLAASLLQKSIRRGLPDLAAYGVTAYHRMRGKQAWHRLIIIAFEDVGVAAPELVAEVTSQCAQALQRPPRNNDAAQLATLARQLAGAPKDRSADYLVSAIKSNPGWEQHRIEVARLPVPDRIRLATDAATDLHLRAAATWYASGINGGRPPMVGRGDLEGLLAGFVRAGVPASLATAVRQAALRTGEPITLFLPLLWLAAGEGRVEPNVATSQLRGSPTEKGLPLWVLDKHTATGKRAIGEFARSNDAVRKALEASVPEFRARDVALMAAFYADAIELDRKFVWPGLPRLEQEGMEADMVSAGAPCPAAPDIIQAVSENLPHLNAIRSRSLAASFRMHLPGLDLGEVR
jgi:hypothetical protein